MCLSLNLYIVTLHYVVWNGSKISESLLESISKAISTLIRKAVVDLMTFLNESVFNSKGVDPDCIGKYLFQVRMWSGILLIFGTEYFGERDLKQGEDDPSRWLLAGYFSSRKFKVYKEDNLCLRPLFNSWLSQR